MIMPELDVVDFHTHVLPNADHGSDSLSTTLKQLEFAKQIQYSSLPTVFPNKKEFEILLQSLIGLRSSLIREGRYADCVDDIIIKLTRAKFRKIHISYSKYIAAGKMPAA